MSSTRARQATFRDVFAVREFRALWASQLLSEVGDRLTLVALTLLIYTRTGSPLLAALTPRDFTVRIIDENVEPIDFDRCARADLVCLTGMIVQRFRMTEILRELRGSAKTSGRPHLHC